MPRLIYKPEGAEPQTLDFDFGKLWSPERVVIEKAATKALDRPVGWDECKRLFFANSTPIIGAVLFVMLNRDPGFTTKLHEFQFCDDDFDVDLSDHEARGVLEEIDKLDEIDDDVIGVRDELRARFTDDLADDEGAEVTALPKAKTG